MASIDDTQSATTNVSTRRRKTMFIGVITLIALALLGAGWIIRDVTTPVQSTQQGVYAESFESMRGVYRQAEHSRVMAGRYLDTAELPADDVFSKAEQGDQNAINAVDEWQNAGTMVNQYHGDCGDMATLYNHSAQLVLAEQGGAEALNQAGMPSSYREEHCYEHEDRNTDEFVPGNWQYYNELDK